MVACSPAAVDADGPVPLLVGAAFLQRGRSVELRLLVRTRRRGCGFRLA